MQDQGTAEAVLRPSEGEAMNTLLDVVKLVQPGASYEAAITDDGARYVHLGTPDGSLNYFIEPDPAGGWEGHLDGGGVPPMATVWGASIPAVAFIAAAALMEWLAGSASQAAQLLHVIGGG